VFAQFNRSLAGLRNAGQVNHVLIGGQSLGHGSGASVLTSIGAGHAWMFRDQQLDDGSITLNEFWDGFVSLCERLGAVNNGSGETVASGFAAYVANAAASPGKGHELLVSNWARGGQVYSNLAKGTVPYARGLTQAKQGRARLGLRHRVQAFLMLHGESDFANASYDTNIRQWQVDVTTDYLAALGDVSGRQLPMFHTQPSSWTCPTFGLATAASPIKIYNEHKANPSKSTLVGPKYIFPYNADGLHMPAASYRWLGGYYGKAYVQQVINGTQWEPLRPSVVSRTANVITVTFTGQVGSLALDTTRVSDPGKFGFEYTDDTSPPAISSVALQGTNQVVVTLATTPTGANKKLRYGYTGTISALAGPTTGPRGCLRDSDASRGAWGEELFNWCVHFEETVA
jgi:hypothetical protein